MRASKLDRATCTTNARGGSEARHVRRVAVTRAAQPSQRKPSMAVALRTLARRQSTSETVPAGAEEEAEEEAEDEKEAEEAMAPSLAPPRRRAADVARAFGAASAGISTEMTAGASVSTTDTWPHE